MLPTDSTVAILNDPTNGGQALLLQAAGLLTRKESAGVNSSGVDFVDNPKNLKNNEIDAASFPRVLNDVTIGASTATMQFPQG